MVHFVGAGSGAVDLITVRGMKYVQTCDVLIYAGSLVNKEFTKLVKPDCKVYNSAKLHLDEIISIMLDAEKKSLMTVRLHTGDPSIYGAIREQMDLLKENGIDYDVTPGVSSFLAAAASMKVEYTLPDISQSLIITRMEGRTKVPKKESIKSFAAHNSTMVIFLSASLLEKLVEELLEGGYKKNTPAAIVYKASWEDEKIFYCDVENIAKVAKKNNITKMALIIVGDFLTKNYSRSKLYSKDFTTEFRKGK